MKRLILGLAAVASVAMALPAIGNAQAVNNREINQQGRISQGVYNGSLTARETNHLETREARIHHSEAVDRAHNHGRLTRAARTRLTHRQKHLSRAIYRAKHNVQHY